MKPALKTLLSAALVGVLAVACVRRAETMDNRTAGASAPQEQDGSASGGGSYMRTNSVPVLTLARTRLAAMIRNSSPQIYKNLPTGWTQSHLADVIENVVSESDVCAADKTTSTKCANRYADNNLLMLDYNRESKDPQKAYIVALRTFFYAYANVPVSGSDTEDYEELKNKVRDVELKLLHEVAHHWAQSDWTSEQVEAHAEAFANSLMEALMKDIVHCQTADVLGWRSWKPWSGDANQSPSAEYHWIFHRPTGYGVFMNSSLWKNEKLSFQQGVTEYATDSGTLPSGEKIARIYLYNRLYIFSPMVYKLPSGNIQRDVADYHWLPDVKNPGFAYTAKFPEANQENLSLTPKSGDSLSGVYSYVAPGSSSASVFGVKCSLNSTPQVKY